MTGNRKGMPAAFCRWYAALGNPKEAAIKAGCPPDTAEDDALRMLRSDSCRRTLAQLAAQPPLPLRTLVTAGLSRLAFGAANDAARLVFDDALSDEKLAELDLFHVTAVKRDKNGVEIRLADRQNAMERLLTLASETDTAAAAAALLSALGGAQKAEEVSADESRCGDALFAETENCSQLVEKSQNSSA